MPVHTGMGIFVAPVFVFSTYAVFIVVVSLITCVDPEGRGCHHKMARLVHRFPARVVWPAIRLVCGERTQKHAAIFIQWLCEKPNPVLQILYLVLICGGYGVVVVFAYPQ